MKRSLGVEESAQIEEDLGSALDESPLGGVGMAVLSGHEFSGGIEGEFGAPRPVVAERFELDATFEGEGEEGGLGGISKATPARIGGIGRNELRIVAQGGAFEQADQVLRMSGIRRGLNGAQFADGSVAFAGDAVGGIGWDPHAADGHLVFGKSAGLVGTNDAGGTERFDGTEATDDGPPGGHALHADGEGDGHGDWETLRDQRDHLADGDHEHVGGGQAAVGTEGHDGDEENEGACDEGATELGETEFERGFGFDGGVGEASDLAHLGGEAGGDDEGAGATGGEMRPGEEHVPAIGEQGILGKSVRVFLDRDRFTGEGGLGGFESGGFEQACIGTHGIAGGEQEDIAWDERHGLDGLLVSAADDADAESGEAFERFHGAFGAALLEGADKSVEQNNGEDDRGVLMFAEHGGEYGGDEEQVDERTLKLGEDDAPNRAALGFRQLVGAEFAAVGFDAAGVETLRGIDIQGTEQRRWLQGMGWRWVARFRDGREIAGHTRHCVRN